MELEEAKNILRSFVRYYRFNEKKTFTEQELAQAIEYFAFDDLVPKKKIEDKHNKFKRQYEDELEKNSIKAFILKCQIEILQELLEDK